LFCRWVEGEGDRLPFCVVNDQPMENKFSL